MTVPALGDIHQTRSGLLILPVRDISGTLQSLQYIAPDGTKRFLMGGKVQEGHFIIPGKSEKPLVLCEGYATGASIHLAVNCIVYVTFSANNLPVVANLGSVKNFSHFLKMQKARQSVKVFVLT